MIPIPSTAAHEMESDHALLKTFNETGDGRAFTELTRRYAGLVYHAAARRAGEAALAEEVTLSTFALLARKASSLMDHDCLAGWLHRTATWLAGDAAAKEFSHRRRMKSYALSSALHAVGEDPLAEALPFLDQAIQSLREADRRLILMRFHDGLSFQVIGERLRQPHDTVRKATGRAVEKLGAVLRRSGVTLSATVLTAALPAFLTSPAPAALLAGLPSAALSTAGSLGWKSLLLHSLHAMNTFRQIAAAAVLATFFAVPTLALQERRLPNPEHSPATSDGPASPAAKDSTEAGNSVGLLTPSTPSSLTLNVLAMLRDLPNAKDPYRAAALTAEALGTVPPELIVPCREAVDSLGNGMMTLILNVALYKRWAELDPAGAMHAAQASKSGNFAVAVGIVTRTWMQRDKDQAIAWLKAAPQTEQDRVFREAGQTLRSLDSAILAEVVGAWDQPRLKLWAEQGIGDTVKSMEIAQHLPPGEIRDTLMRSAAHSEIREPLAVLTWCQTHLEGAEKFNALTNLMFAWSSSDPDAALEWYLRQPPGTAMAAALSNSKKFQDDQYFAAFRQRLPEAERASLDLHRVMMMEPSQAASRLDSLPPGPERTELHATIARNWVESEPAAASRWIDSLPAGPERDSAATGLAKVIQRTDVSAAMTWAESIQDADLRSQTLLHIWRDWLARDGVAAGAWLHEGDTLPAARALILQSKNSTGK